MYNSVRAPSVVEKEQDPNFMKPQNRYGAKNSDINFPDLPLKRNNSMFKSTNNLNLNSERKKR